IDLVINIVDQGIKKEVQDDYHIGRAAIENNIVLFTKVKTTSLFIDALLNYKLFDLEVKPWSEYLYNI
ncbi:MAG TPA: hypothetical protein VLG12_05190, partial [Candidatus Saccharimonadales bacterium]|nr:hypothetical protein [Candidatus Saccharimonadales bacterium]